MIVSITKVYTNGRTTVPEAIREFLKLENGQRLIWRIKKGKVIVEKQK